MRIWKSYLLLGTVALLLGCEDAAEPEVTRLEFAGEVNNASTTDPIEGARIWFTYGAGGFGTGSQTATSDVDGSYVLIFDPPARIASCEFMSLYAEADGYERSDIRNVACTEDRQVQNFALSPDSS